MRPSKVITPVRRQQNVRTPDQVSYDGKGSGRHLSHDATIWHRSNQPCTITHSSKTRLALENPGAKTVGLLVQLLRLEVCQNVENNAMMLFQRPWKGKSA